jgi:hypothetical protein
MDEFKNRPPLRTRGETGRRAISSPALGAFTADNEDDPEPDGVPRRPPANSPKGERHAMILLTAAPKGRAFIRL